MTRCTRCDRTIHHNQLEHQYIFVAGQRRDLFLCHECAHSAPTAAVRPFGTEMPARIPKAFMGFLV